MEAPAPQAQGVFAKTPFSNLLVYAMDRRLNGTMELAAPDGRAVSVWFVDGLPAKARLSEAAHFLGDVLVELGYVGDEQHQLLLTQNQVSGDLYGQALLAQGAISPEQLMEGLGAQLQRKLEYVFSLPPETSFAYYDGYNSLEGFGADDYPQIDPLVAMWAGVRANPPWDHVHQTLTRLGTAAVRLAAHATPDRFGFGKAERAALDLLRQRPHRVAELSTSKVIGPTAAQLLVYCLLITKQVELVEMPPSIRPGAPSNAPPALSAQGSPASPRTPGLLPQPGASAPPPPRQAAPPPPPAPPGPQAPGAVTSPSATAASTGIAKVQLKQSAISTGLSGGVKEQIVATSARDLRLASPAAPMAPPGATTAARPLTATSPSASFAAAKPATASSFAPARPSGSLPAASPSATSPGGPPSSQRSVPAAPASQRSFAPAPSNSRLPAAPGSTGSLPAAAPSNPSVSKMAAAIPPHKKAEYDAIRKRVTERAEKISGLNFYEMLEVKPDAKPEEIQKAYIIAAKTWHPDQLPAPLADLKDACSKVFAHISEANKVLTDPKRRAEYVTLLKDGGATPDDQAKIQTILEATTNFAKAEMYLKKNNLAEAEVMCRKAWEADNEQADYLALLAWLESQKVHDKDQVAQKIVMLTTAIKMSPNCERAYFYRGMLLKKVDNFNAAVKDFRKAAELNPRNTDAMREVRLHTMRGPAASAAKADAGGLFGKLFKK